MKNKLIISIITGLIFASSMMYIAWKHNPQHEIYNEETIYFGYWITIGLSWFILGFIVVLLFITILNKMTNFK